MKETAVEWLRKQIILNSKLKETKTGKISFTIGLSMLDEVIEQAKEMEREQMIYIIKTYHNNLFYLPLSENGEADRILDLILTKQIKPKL
jgi:hypothetical protein